MKRSLFFSLVILLWGVPGFAQEAKTALSPTDITAGKNFTITITVDKAEPIQGSLINVTLAPKDPKDVSDAFNVNVWSQNNNPLVYSGTAQTPLNAKGVWYVKEAVYHLPISGGGPLQIDHPEFTVKPVKTTIPTSGKVVLSGQ